MRRDGRGVFEIARAIGRSKSMVSRELKRNSCERFYRASTAQRRYAERRKACRRRRMLDDERVFNLVRDKFLEEQWSPEHIEGRLALELGGTPSRQRHHHLLRRPTLLRASAPYVAALHQREHQRPPAGVFPEGRVAGTREREARAGGVR